MSKSDKDLHHVREQEGLAPQPALSPASNSGPITSAYNADIALDATRDGEKIDLEQPATRAEADQSGQHEVGLDQSRITARIKNLYRELLEAPIPEEWLRLVDAIESKERK